MSKKNKLNAASVAAVLSTAALVLGSLAAPALAEDAHIRVADLDLNTPQGRAQFDVRVKTAAWRMCWSDQELSERAACERAFREAADENLAEQTARLARQQGVSALATRR